MEKKYIQFDKNAKKEIERFPDKVQAKLKMFLEVLSRDGKLIEPYGKKIENNLFEIRICCGGQWRIIYAYIMENVIVVLSGFHKKTQQTAKAEIAKAKYRLRSY